MNNTSRELMIARLLSNYKANLEVASSKSLNEDFDALNLYLDYEVQLREKWGITPDDVYRILEYAQWNRKLKFKTDPRQEAKRADIELGDYGNVVLTLGAEQQEDLDALKARLEAVRQQYKEQYNELIGLCKACGYVNNAQL